MVEGKEDFRVQQRGFKSTSQTHLSPVTRHADTELSVTGTI